MQRLGIFAHFDAGGRIQPYVLQHLEALREVCRHIVFASTAGLSSDERRKLHGLADEVVEKENVGFDFGTWGHALRAVNRADWDELVLTNTSVIGPLSPLGEIFVQMAAGGADFWAMTDSHEGAWHLQSYFLVFRSAALQLDLLPAFFMQFTEHRDKQRVIDEGELRLTRVLMDHGLKPAAFVSCDRLPGWGLLRRLRRRRRSIENNPTLIHPAKLLELGMPYVKLELLRDNPNRVDLEPVLDRLRAAGMHLPCWD